jgi:hypothetical protein
MALLQPKNPIFRYFRPRNGSETVIETAIETAEKRSSARLVLLLVVMNDRGKFHSHRVRHRGGCAELVWWCPQGCGPTWVVVVVPLGPRWSQNIVATLRTQIPKLT